MKSRVTLTLILTVGMVVSLVSLPATAHASPHRFMVDSGVVTPGEGQVLRTTISPTTLPNGAGGNATISVRLAWMQYGSEGCSGVPPVCRHMVVSRGSTPAQTLGENDALSFDVQGSGNGVRLMVFANQNVQVLFQLLNDQGQVVAFFRRATVEIDT